MAIEDEDQLLSAVPFTCRITAGFRAIELRKAKDPIIVDNLAIALAGSKALAHAVDEWERLEKLQGEGKHLRVPARSRLIDDRVLELLSGPYAEADVVQVVCLGAGMDTRPWRLTFPVSVSYFEVDQPEVQHLKEPLLKAAGAETSKDVTSPPDTQFKFPLKCSSWAGLGHDLSQPGLIEKLQSAGFEPSKPTIWVAEAVIYYLEFPRALALVESLADASPAGSWFVLTCIDKDLYDGHLKLEDHVFAKLWHFYVDQLVPEMEKIGFKVVDPPETTQQLALRLHNADLYIPEYGGFETLFSCKLEKAS